MKCNFLGLPQVEAVSFENQIGIPEDPGTVYLDTARKIELAVWLAMPTRPLWIYGPTGCGKTHLAKWLAHHTQRGLLRFSANGSTDVEDLIGHLTLVDGEVIHQDGPVTSAMRNGQIVVIDEGDIIAPDVWTTLHSVLEGEPVTLNKGGVVVVKPKPGFQVIVTANSRGAGENRATYKGTKELNQATLNRFYRIEMDYMPVDIETEIVKHHAPQVLKPVANSYVRAADSIRNAAKAASIERGISTRDVIAWTQLTVQFKNAGLAAKEAMIAALNAVFGGGLEESERIAVENLAKSVL
ncbi:MULTISPECIES: AAA family ATPase [Acidithiobacillus]|jgi:cobaltochelatase CobS|uniref:AAA family ATPase n=1 Tax=Acidithiobacillus TaxID=119977 RepID=UPI00068E8DF3|nr:MULTISPECIES: AAA family ATPase [Acidithiobacillus]